MLHAAVPSAAPCRFEYPTYYSQETRRFYIEVHREFTLLYMEMLKSLLEILKSFYAEEAVFSVARIIAEIREHYVEMMTIFVQSTNDPLRYLPHVDAHTVNACTAAVRTSLCCPPSFKYPELYSEYSDVDSLPPTYHNDTVSQLRYRFSLGDFSFCEMPIIHKFVQDKNTALSSEYLNMIHHMLIAMKSYRWPNETKMQIYQAIANEDAIKKRCRAVIARVRTAVCVFTVHTRNFSTTTFATSLRQEMQLCHETVIPELLDDHVLNCNTLLFRNK